MDCRSCCPWIGEFAIWCFHAGWAFHSAGSGGIKNRLPLHISSRVTPRQYVVGTFQDRGLDPQNGATDFPFGLSVNHRTNGLRNHTPRHTFVATVCVHRWLGAHARRATSVRPREKAAAAHLAHFWRHLRDKPLKYLRCPVDFRKKTRHPFLG